MGRQIYIISKSMRVEDAIEDAAANNCPEIVQGIPPRLKKELRGKKLPIVFEESEPPKIYTYEAFVTKFVLPETDTIIYGDRQLLHFNHKLSSETMAELEVKLHKTVKEVE